MEVLHFWNGDSFKRDLNQYNIFGKAHIQDFEYIFQYLHAFVFTLKKRILIFWSEC